MISEAAGPSSTLHKAKHQSITNTTADSDNPWGLLPSGADLETASTELDGLECYLPEYGSDSMRKGTYLWFPH